jgi:biopolymer transport protein ExbD
MRRRIREEEETGELNIVPSLDVVVHLVMFMLLSMTGLITLGLLNVSAPRIGGEGGAAAALEPGPRLLLTVAVGRQGFSIAGAGGLLGPDANATGLTGAPTIPLRADGTYDFEALSAQLATIKEKFPSESQVILSADGSVIYDILIQTMDACRELTVKSADGKVERKALFVDVSLSVVG